MLEIILWGSLFFFFFSKGRKNTAACHFVLTLLNHSSIYFGVEDIKTVPTSTLMWNTLQLNVYI